MLITLLSFTSLWSQNYTTTNITTAFTSSSKMIYNYTTREYDFSENNDVTEFQVDWVFRVNSQNQGMVTSNAVNYDILEYKQVDEKVIVLTVFNLKVQRKMKMFIMKENGSFIISVVDEPNRNIFYFYP